MELERQVPVVLEPLPEGGNRERLVIRVRTDEEDVQLHRFGLHAG